MKTYGLLWMLLIGAVAVGMVCCVGELALFTHNFGNTLP